MHATGNLGCSIEGDSDRSVSTEVEAVCAIGFIQQLAYTVVFYAVLLYFNTLH